MEVNYLEMPIWQMTARQLIDLLSHHATPQPEVQQSVAKQYVYGLSGLRQLIGCSHVTAQRIKDSGKLKGCFSQVGRKLVFDADAVLNALKK